jgi:hypothetical protein
MWKIYHNFLENFLDIGLDMRSFPIELDFPSRGVYISGRLVKFPPILFFFQPVKDPVSKEALRKSLCLDKNYLFFGFLATMSKVSAFYD